jgi:(R,R)-butanediol dehydrogenase/meso-butanediol dehydrogenase/diacetyl reductase
MKAAVYHGPLDVRIEEVPEPGPPGPDEVLVAPLMGSLCGTDVTEFVTGPKMIPLHHPHPVSGHQGPVILGHECMGIVIEVGTAVSHLHAGQRVVLGAGGSVEHVRCAWPGAPISVSRRSSTASIRTAALQSR